MTLETADASYGPTPPPSKCSAAAMSQVADELKDWTPLSEDNWREEINTIPLFMDSLEGVDVEQNVGVQALQALAYDGTPEEIARNFKDQGNAIVQAKQRAQFPEAVTFYTRGLEQKLDANRTEAVLRLQLLINRAHVHLELENFRRAYTDCTHALKLLFDEYNKDPTQAAIDLKPLHAKLVYRLARAQLGVGQFQQCRATITSSLQMHGDPAAKQAMLALRKQLDSREQTAAKLHDAKVSAGRRRSDRAVALQNFIARSGIRVAGNLPLTTRDQTSTAKNSDQLLSPGTFSPSRLFHLPDAFTFAPKLLADGSAASWPVVLIFPQVMQMDAVPQWADDVSGKQMLTAMASECPLEWDTERNYTVDNVALYIPVPDVGTAQGNWKWRRVRILQPLGKLLTEPDFVLAEDGVVRLWVVPRPDGTGAGAKWTRDRWAKKLDD